MAVILHVSEAWGGGIVTATEYIAAQAPEHEHHVLYLPRGEIGRAPDPDVFTHVFEHHGNRRTFALHVRRLMGAPIYDVVHSHSSWAGALCRLLPAHGARQFYSPHCFAFERRDVSELTRRVFRRVERLAVDRTDTLVANGRHEAELARRLGHRHIVDLPMVGRWTSPAAPAAPAGGDTPRIVMVGRVAPQKDPEYFARLVQVVRRRWGRPVDATWIGAPDMDNVADVLVANDIEVTGWLDDAAVAAELRRATVYVHSASWEAGAPLAVIDAARAGLPVVVRDVACLSWTGFPAAPTLGRHAAIVEQILSEHATRAAIVNRTQAALRDLERQAATIDLGRSYGSPVRLVAA